MWELVVSACVCAAVSILEHVREIDMWERRVACGRLPVHVPSRPLWRVGFIDLQSSMALGP